VGAVGASSICPHAAATTSTAAVHTPRARITLIRCIDILHARSQDRNRPASQTYAAKRPVHRYARPTPDMADVDMTLHVRRMTERGARSL
jgi:hypothetical protein